MKYTTLLVLACLGVCLVSSAKLSTWGNVNGRILNIKNIKVESKVFQVRTHEFTYQSPNGSPINGIKHVDFKQHPVEVNFIKGDIGQTSVTILLKSQRGHGINSEFTFYTN